MCNILKTLSWSSRRVAEYLATETYVGQQALPETQIVLFYLWWLRNYMSFHRCKRMAKDLPVQYGPESDLLYKVSFFCFLFILLVFYPFRFFLQLLLLFLSRFVCCLHFTRGSHIFLDSQQLCCILAEFVLFGSHPCPLAGFDRVSIRCLYWSLAHVTFVNFLPPFLCFQFSCFCDVLWFSNGLSDFLIHVDIFTHLNAVFKSSSSCGWFFMFPVFFCYCCGVAASRIHALW